MPLLIMASVNVDEEVLDDFREAVFRRHGKVYKYLKDEATAALRAHADAMREGGRLKQER